MTASAIVYLERSNTKIAIQIQSVEEFLENKIIKVAIPRVGNQTTVPQTKYKDLKKINHVFNIQGAIYAQQSTNASAENYDANIKVQGSTDVLSATQAKNSLIYYVLYPDSKNVGDINFYWRGLPSTNANQTTALASLMDATDTARVATVVFEKVSFKDAPATLKEIVLGALFDHSGQVDTKKYLFNATLVKGVTF